MTFGAGGRLSHYRLLGTLGQGGFGTVYRAEDVRLGRHVALKILPPGHSVDAATRRRFRAEARAISALDHPNVCVLYDFDDSGERPFLAMQLVDGETLQQVLERGPLDELRVCAVVGAVGRALEAAHARGILHRDVKSDNILLGRDGSIKLTDFGLALLTRGAGVTTSSVGAGTPHYMAPEQIDGKGASEASDQFSLAVVAYESLTGARPFASASITGLLFAIVNSEPEPPTRRRPGIRAEWDAVLRRALAKDPLGRYPAVREFAAAVADLAPAATRSRPAPADAAELCVRGRRLYLRYTSDDNLRALECFERAAAIDPDCAAAWTGIADCCGQMHDKGWDGNPVWLERGHAAAARALATDPRSPSTHKAMAMILLQRRDPEGAVASLRRAIEIDPSYVPAWVNLAAALRGTGDLAEAERSLRTALRIDPREPFVPWALAYVLVFTRRYAESVACCDRFQRLGPSPYYQLRARVLRACAHAYLANFPAAEREIAEGKRTALAPAGLRAAECLVAARAGIVDRARGLLHESEVELADHLPLHWVLADAAGWLGDEGSALRILGATERKTVLDHALLRVLPGLGRIGDCPRLAAWFGERGRRLVWPREAPALEPELRARFTDYAEASGLPDAEAGPAGAR